MSSKTKIVVLRMKELIYTGIFIGLAILLIILFFFMFQPKEPASETAAKAQTYFPGVYTSSLQLGNQSVNVEVAVDSNCINGVSLVSLSESVTTMYPLIAPTLSSLNEQIQKKQSLDALEYTPQTQYTSQALEKAINRALKKARVTQPAS